MRVDFQPAVTSKHEIVLARVMEGTLVNSMLAGFAVQFEGESHYVIRLTMFPNIPYYLCKNRDSHSGYTVFAKLVRDSETGNEKFQNPIGSGKLLPDLKSHLEIRFPLISSTVFMNLFPK